MNFIPAIRATAQQLAALDDDARFAIIHNSRLELLTTIERGARNAREQLVWAQDRWKAASQMSDLVTGGAVGGRIFANGADFGAKDAQNALRQPSGKQIVTHEAQQRLNQAMQQTGETMNAATRLYVLEQALNVLGGHLKLPDDDEPKPKVVRP